MSSLDAASLQRECAADELPWRIQVAEEIASTSDAVREAALRGEAAGLVQFAESQTRGRGRRENRWITPKGKDLMVSLLLRPAAPLECWPRITTLAALAICKAIEDELPLSPQIKWPNDVYVRGKKVAGLLAETVACPGGMAVILGIGLNVNTREFPSELEATATSLSRELHSEVSLDLDRESLAFRLLKALHEELQRLEHGFVETVADVRSRSWLLGKQIRATVNGSELYGRVLDLNAEGHLVIALPDGATSALASAESVRQVV